MADYKPLRIRQPTAEPKKSDSFGIGLTIGFMFGFAACAILLAVFAWWMV
jgi:hypothetical protein